MHPSNKERFRYCRIDRWHEAGYTGKGVVVAVWEDITQGHGKGSLDVLSQVAPDAVVLGCPRPGFRTVNGVLAAESRDKLVAWLRAQAAHGASIVSFSKSGGDNKAFASLVNECLPEVTLFAAAGNDSKDIPSRAAAYYDETFLAVGAAYLLSGEPVRAHYSNTGEHLDVVGFTGTVNDKGVAFTGTSAATPFLAGMAALYHQLFKERAGRFPTRKETWDFIKQNCEDLEGQGWDGDTGHGLFRLPEELPCVESEPVEPPAKEPQPPAGGDKPMIVCIDPGHGGPDSGAVSQDGIQEKKVTLTVAKRVAEYLRRAGVKVVLTRDTDMELVAGNDSTAELRARAKVANDAKADYFISIHCNAASSPDAEGYEVFCYPGSIVGAVLANRIAHAYGIASGLPLRRVETANFQVLRDTAMPAALLELGFLTNKADRALLKEPAFLDKCALGIAFGILKMERG